MKKGNAKVFIDEENHIRIKGMQKDINPAGDNFFQIDGIIEIIDRRNFYFIGKMKLDFAYYPKHNNGGPRNKKILNGKYLFRKTGSRKYWRLKDYEGYFTRKDSGINLHHYIDIHNKVD